jgi:hypothetical protein
MARSIVMTVQPARSSTSIDFCPSQVFLPQKLFSDFKQVSILENNELIKPVLQEGRKMDVEHLS